MNSCRVPWATCKQAQSGAVDVAFVYSSGRVPLRRREGLSASSGRHAQEHHLPGCHLQGTPRRPRLQTSSSRWATTNADAKQSFGRRGFEPGFLGLGAHTVVVTRKGWDRTRPSFPCDKGRSYGQHSNRPHRYVFSRAAMPIVSCALAMAIAFIPGTALLAPMKKCDLDAPNAAAGGTSAQSAQEDTAIDDAREHRRRWEIGFGRR